MKIVFTFLTEKKNLFWSNKKFVYLIFINKLLWYHPKITYENILQKDRKEFYKNKIIVISSQNNIRKYFTKGQERVL